MGFILRDFECPKHGVFEAVVDSALRSKSCPACGHIAKKILTFCGLIKVQGESDLPPLLARDSGLAREVSPGKSLNRPWEEEREHSKVRWVEKKLPDGRMVRRPSIKIDEPKSRGLNSNLEKDLARTVVKRRS